MIERRQRRRRGLTSTGKIGKYILEESLRTQPTRSLYRAYDPFLDRQVAIKIIQLFDPENEQTSLGSEIFFSESRTIGQLQHHRIVSVYDAGVGDYQGYIVMEFINGKSLLQALNQQKTLPIKHALEIAIQICEALEYANNRGVVHRDIKPSNIMLTSDNNIKVVDFGISILDKGQSNNQSKLMGTPSYIAPELVHGKSASLYSDLYSLSVVLYEMVLGRLPYVGSDAHAVLYKVINEPMQPITEELPNSLKKFLLQALDKDPQQRFNSCGEYQQHLVDLLIEIDKTDYTSDIDTSKLRQMQIFNDCNSEVIHELAACLAFEKVSAGEDIISQGMLDEYVCLVQGKALFVSDDQHIIVPVGRWLSENGLPQNIGPHSCKALTNSLVLRVSKSNVLESSVAAQAYFFGLVLDNIFIP